MGADRGQFQAAARGQQPVSGQPRGAERRPERGGVRPRAVPAVEVLAQPAAVERAARVLPRRRARRRARPSPTLLILFLKLSEKLYTSVFHHGLKVGGPRRGAGGTGAARRGELAHPDPGPRRLSPPRTTRMDAGAPRLRAAGLGGKGRRPQHSERSSPPPLGSADSTFGFHPGHGHGHGVRPAPPSQLSSRCRPPSTWRTCSLWI